MPQLWPEAALFRQTHEPSFAIGTIAIRQDNRRLYFLYIPHGDVYFYNIYDGFVYLSVICRHLCQFLDLHFAPDLSLRCALCSRKEATGGRQNRPGPEDPGPLLCACPL